jgi:hypothetical protein
MIKKTFGNFHGTIDPLNDTVFIRGARGGWTATYTLEELPGKIAFYVRMIEHVRTKQTAGGGDLTGSYKETRDCLKWALRVIQDG